VKTALLLVFRIHGEAFSRAILYLKCKESVNNGRTFIIGSLVAVGFKFCDDRYEVKSLIVVKETESRSIVLS
jgi:hypothetical protein